MSEVRNLKEFDKSLMRFVLVKKKENSFLKGAFTNYVDKKRWVGSPN